MKIYIDELPKSCDDCEFGYFYDCQYCTLRPDLMRKDEWCEKEKHCPLETTQSLKHQVRKEVCEEIKSLGEPFPYKQGSEPYMWIISQKDLGNILEEYKEK